MVEFELKQCIF